MTAVDVCQLKGGGSIMPAVPVITLEHLSKIGALTNLLDKYPAPEQQDAILRQLLETPIVSELPRLFKIEELVKLFPEHNDLMAQKLLTPAMLQLFSQGDNGIARIAALVQAFSNKKDEIAVKILHLDTFKILVESPEDVRALIAVFAEHKNGIALLVFNKEVFPVLAISPAAIKSLINLFPELPDYRTLIAQHVFPPPMLHALIDQNIQNAVELANIFPEHKSIIAAVVLDPTLFNSLLKSSNFSFANFAAGFHENKERIVELLSESQLLQSLVRQGTHKVAELCRVFAEYPKFIEQIAKEVLDNQTFDLLIQSTTQVHDLTMIAAFTDTVPSFNFNNRLAQKIVNNHKLLTLIKSAADIEVLTSALPGLKEAIAQTALEEPTFQSLLRPPGSYLKPIRRLEQILSALLNNRNEIAELILNLGIFQKLITSDKDVAALIKLFPDRQNEIQQRTAEASKVLPSAHAPERFFTPKHRQTSQKKSAETPQHTKDDEDQTPNSKSSKP